MIPEVSDPAKSQQIANLMMGFGTGDMGPALAGAIRSGGNPYLQATHVLSSPAELMNVRTGKPFAELSSPSYSIRDVRDFPKPPEIVPSDNPVYVAFQRDSLEPKNISNALFGTDMWNRTGADMARGLTTPGSRLEQRFGKSTEDMRLQAGTPPTVGHTTAIELARPLNSLKHYENSPEGVGRLYKSQYPEEWELSFENDLLNWIEGQSGQHRADLRNMLTSQQLMGSAGGFGPELLNASARGDRTAQALVKSAREAPAAYAEGKVRGPLGVGNIGGMGFQEFPVNTRSRDAAATNAVRNYYESLGVPTAGYRGGKGSGTRIAEMIDQLEQQAGPFGGR